MAKRYHDAEWLRKKYHEEGMTQAEIADECGVSATAIRDWMKRHEIPRRDVEGENHGLYGTKRSDEVKQSISETLAGREYPEEWCQRSSESHRGNSISDETRQKISESLRGMTRPESTRRKMSESTMEAMDGSWGGAPLQSYGPGWSAARRQVRERDEVCQYCGEEESGRNLDVHHIIPLRAFRKSSEHELSDGHALENLVLLCRQCHVLSEYGDIGFESGIEAPASE